MSYKISEIEDMFAAELDSDGQFDEWGAESFNQNATLQIDRVEDANIFTASWGKKEELESISLLSEADKKLQTDKDVLKILEKNDEYIKHKNLKKVFSELKNVEELFPEKKLDFDELLFFGLFVWCVFIFLSLIATNNKLCVVFVCCACGTKMNVKRELGWVFSDDMIGGLIKT